MKLSVHESFALKAVRRLLHVIAVCQADVIYQKEENFVVLARFLQDAK